MHKSIAFVFAVVAGCSGEHSSGAPPAERAGRTAATRPRSEIAIGVKLPSTEPAQTAWDSALTAIRQLNPNAFEFAPEAVRSYFAQQGCTIPQGFHSEEAHNLISGEFAARGQTDWAALCSRNDTSEIVILWGGPAQCPSRIAAGSDAGLLQTIGGGRIGYSRAIQTVDKRYIDQHAKAYEGPEPPGADHDGIDDAFLGKASVVRFCHSNRWLRLQGAD